MCALLRRALFTAVTMLPPTLGLAQGLVWEHVGDWSEFSFGWAMARAGDADGDGSQDFAIGSYGSNSGTSSGAMGRVNVYSGADRQLIRSLQGQTSHEYFGRALDALGDLDHDGHDDLLVGAPGRSRVVIVSGADGSVLREWLALPNGGGLGSAVATLGDVNGDGWIDVAASSLDGPGHVLVLSGANASVLRDIAGFSASQSFGRRIASGGDLDGDGIDDLAISAGETLTLPTRVYLFSGASGALLRTIDTPAAGIDFGDALLLVPDFDGDGRDELAIGAPSDATAWNEAGAVRIYSGATGQILRTLLGSPWDNFGCALDLIGDLDGDGRGDLLVGAGGTMLAKGYVAVRSSASGAELQRLRSTLRPFGTRLRALPDTDGDGYPDYLVGAEGFIGSKEPVFLVTSGTSRGMRYCVAKTDSLGCRPSIDASGTPRAGGADDFHLSCAQVQHYQYGVLFWGRDSATTAFAGGTLCVRAPLVRTAIQYSGGSAASCSGSFDFHLSHARMTAFGIQPGELLRAQYWSRDPGFGEPNNISLSDAWAFVVGL